MSMYYIILHALNIILQYENNNVIDIMIYSDFFDSKKKFP